MQLRLNAMRFLSLSLSLQFKFELVYYSLMVDEGILELKGNGHVKDDSTINV